MTENKNLEALKNIGPVKTNEDIRNFNAGVLGAFIESYDAMFNAGENGDKFCKTLVNNIADIAVENIPPKYMKSCIHVPSIPIILGEKSTGLQAHTDIAAFIKEKGHKTSYENLAQFIVSTSNAVLEKKPEEHNDSFKINTLVNPDFKAYQKVGFNKMDIKPALASHARVF